jgi:hypothetical protein
VDVAAVDAPEDAGEKLDRIVWKPSAVRVAPGITRRIVRA